MENASKALIIAGAILLSILLIAVGMYVFNGAQAGIDEAVLSMNSTQKQMFNQNFTQYEGAKVSGYNVKALIGNIISSNNTNQDIVDKLVGLDTKGMTLSESSLKVEYTGEQALENENTISKIKAYVNTGKTYTVTLETQKATGLVNKVTIADTTGSGSGS